MSLRWKTYGMYWLCKLPLKILSGISPIVSNSLDLDQVKKIVWSDLDPNSLQMLSADDRSQQKYFTLV